MFRDSTKKDSSENETSHGEEENSTQTPGITIERRSEENETHKNGED